MSSKILEERVKEALRKVIDPELGQDLVTLNMVKSIEMLENTKVLSVEIELTTAGCPLKAKIEKDCRDALATLEGVGKLNLHFSARPRSQKKEVELFGVRNILLVASGKGGVGKSTVAVHIARAFYRNGYRVGILDADLYGPNVPNILGNFTKPMIAHDNKLLPVLHEGIPFISMGLLLESQQPVIWRGPMLHGAIRQFLADVRWQELDYLFIDLPPGTGDVQLSLSQLVALNGAIVVTTPQELSVSDVRKGIAMFRQLQIPILGIIENMSYYIEPSTQKKIYVFGKDGGKNLSEEWNLPLLAQIPIDSSITEDSVQAHEYFQPIVSAMLASLSKNQENEKNMKNQESMKQESMKQESMRKVAK